MAKKGEMVWISSALVLFVASFLFLIILTYQGQKEAEGNVQLAPANQLTPSTMITQCGNLTESGTYYVAATIYIENDGCFLVSADNVTLEGNGFTISGNNPAYNAGYYGVEARNRANVTVRNLAITNFSFGIYFENVDNSFITNDKVMYHTNDGIYLSMGSDGNVISGNNVSENEYHGISIDGSSYNVIDSNIASLNSIVLYNQSGILLYDGANYNNVTNNVANANDDVGIYVYKSSYNTITGNSANENDYGIYLQNGSSNNIIKNNNANSNILLGLTLDGGSGNKVEGNVMSGNIRAGLPVFASSNNELKNNDIATSEFGLFLGSGSDNNAISDINIDSSQYDAISLSLSSYNELRDIAVTNTAEGYYDIAVDNDSVANRLVNTHLGAYYFAEEGVNISFKDDNEGEIIFLGLINGSGSSLKDDVNIGSNSISVNSAGNPGFNVGAELLLEDVPVIAGAKMLRDGAECPAEICTNLTALSGDVRLRVSGFTTYSIGVPAPPSEGRGPGGGGPGGGPPAEWTETFGVNQERFIAGEAYRNQFAVKNRVKFTLAGIEHYVGVLDVGAAVVKIKVASAPQEDTLTVESTRKYDINDDGYYDVEVTLNGIVGGKADISIKYIHEAIYAAEVPVTPVTPPAPREEIPEEAAAEERPIGTYIIIGVLAIAVIIVLVVLIRWLVRRRAGRGVEVPAVGVPKKVVERPIAPAAPPKPGAAMGGFASDRFYSLKNNIEEALKRGQIMRAEMMYNELRKTYLGLGEEEQKRVKDDAEEIYNKIVEARKKAMEK